MRSILLLVLLSLAAGESFAGVDRFSADRCLFASFAGLLRGAHPNVEVAAFVVAADDGALSCLLWPRMAWVRSQTFTGRIPKGTVAIVHTHPPHEELPSANDMAESRRIGLPFFVVTPTAVWAFDPSAGKNVRTTTAGDWIGAAMENCPRPHRSVR